MHHLDRQLGGVVAVVTIRGRWVVGRGRPPLRHVRRSRRRHGRRILLQPGVCLVQRRRRRVHAHLIAGPELALLDAELCGDVCVPVLPGELPPLLLNHVITRQPLRITLHRRKLVVERTARLTGKIIHV